MSANGSNNFLNIEDANLRVRSGSVHAQGMTIGGITVGTAHGLQSVTDTSNTTSNTLQFTNATTAFKATSNIELTSASKIIVDSNVVTEYTGPHDRPLRKYPEVALTADDNLSTSGYKASVSSLLTGQNGFYAFDVTGATTFWHSQYPYYTFVTGTYNPGQSALGTGTPANGTTLPTTELISGHQGEWIKLQMPKKIKLEEVRVYASNRAAANNVYQMPKDIAIAGSNDGTNWYLVDSGTLRTGIRESYGMASLPVTTSSYYSYLTLIVKTTDNQGANYSAIEIANIEYYGREEGDASLDTTLKTVYNVPATTGTQLEVYYDGQNYTSGTTVNDLAGTQQNGTFNGGFDPTYKAFTFNGTSQNMTTTLANSGTPSAYVHTFAFWTKPISNLTNATQQAFLQLGTHSANSCSALRIEESTGIFRWFFHSNDIRYSVDHIIFGEWNHIVAAYDGGSEITSRRIWVNGHEIHHLGSQTPGALSLSANAPLSIGSQNGGSSSFNGSIANFRLYSKALNAGQVQELYDFQKDYFLGSKSQLTLYKGHLGVGVTEPSGQLELAGDERLQEYPPGPMSDYETLIPGHGVFKVYISGIHQEQANYPGWKAFNDNPDGTYDAWITYDPSYNNGVHTLNKRLSSNTPVGEYIILQFPYKVKISLAKLHERANDTDNAPSGGVFYGSNDGVSWTELKSFSGLTYTNTAGVYSDVEINATEYFDKIALVVTNIDDSTNTWMGLGELRYFGTPGPTTLDKGSLTLGRSLDVPRVSRYDVDTETPRPEKLLVDFDTTVNSSPTDISGQGNHGAFYNGAEYLEPEKAFKFVGVDNNNQAANSSDTVRGTHGLSGTRPVHSHSVWFKQTTDHTDYTWVCAAGTATSQQQSAILLSGNSSYPNRITFDNYNGWVTSTVTAELNRWYHVVATFNGGTNFNTTNCRIYVDGVDCTGPESEVHNGTATFNLQGAILALGSTHNGTRGLTGLVSNYKLYNVVLEPSEVRKLYRLGRTGRSMVISDTAVGIGKVPKAQLDVRGNLNVDGVITNQQRPAFYVWRDDTSGTTAYKDSTGVITNWDSIRVDTAGTFDLSNGRYYIPVSGLYNFVGAGLYRYMGSGNAILEVSFYVNGSNVNVRGISYNRGNTTSEHHTVTITFLRFMNAGDYVQMGIHSLQTACDLYYGDGLGYFSGYLLG